MKETILVWRTVLLVDKRSEMRVHTGTILKTEFNKLLRNFESSYLLRYAEPLSLTQIVKNECSVLMAICVTCLPRWLYLLCVTNMIMSVQAMTIWKMSAKVCSKWLSVQRYNMSNEFRDKVV